MLNLSALEEDMSRCDGLQHSVERDGLIFPGVGICLVPSKLKEFKQMSSPTIIWLFCYSRSLKGHAIAFIKVTWICLFFDVSGCIKITWCKSSEFFLQDPLLSLSMSHEM